MIEYMIWYMILPNILSLNRHDCFFVRGPMHIHYYKEGARTKGEICITSIDKNLANVSLGHFKIPKHVL